MKAGDIVESYQGKFAKVIRIGETGETWLSAWVKTPEQAEFETVAVTWLNDFGLSQVLKGGERVEGAEDQASAGGGDGMVAVADMTVDALKAYAVELGLSVTGKKADLVARIEKHLAELVETEMEDHTVTEEDLEANPELVAQGIKVGDVIKVPVAE
jgi:hypothetical protein